MGADGLIDWIREAGFEKSVEISEAQNPFAFVPFDIECATQANYTFSERPRFVRTEHVHASKVFNRGEALDDHFLFRHPLGTAREIDADDRGEQLRRQPNRERKRKQK